MVMNDAASNVMQLNRYVDREGLIKIRVLAPVELLDTDGDCEVAGSWVIESSAASHNGQKATVYTLSDEDGRGTGRIVLVNGETAVWTRTCENDAAANKYLTSLVVRGSIPEGYKRIEARKVSVGEQIIYRNGSTVLEGEVSEIDFEISAGQPAIRIYTGENDVTLALMDEVYISV